MFLFWTKTSTVFIFRMLSFEWMFLLEVNNAQLLVWILFSVTTNDGNGYFTEFRIVFQYFQSKTKKFEIGTLTINTEKHQFFNQPRATFCALRLNLGGHLGVMTQSWGIVLFSDWLYPRSMKWSVFYRSRATFCGSRRGVMEGVIRGSRPQVGEPYLFGLLTFC